MIRTCINNSIEYNYIMILTNNTNTKYIQMRKVMDAFENLKNSQSNFDKLTKQIEASLNLWEATKSKDKYKDDRLWKLT